MGREKTKPRGSTPNPGRARAPCTRKKTEKTFLTGAAFLIFLWGQFLPPFSAPGTAAEQKEPVELEEEVVSAAVFEEDRDRSPGAVTVIRADELRGESLSLPDLLERIPGLHIVRARGRGAYTVASIRGSTSAQVAVYVDGALQNLASEAAVDLSAIPVGEVERIEVYRGYIPSRFPEAALGGVINIVTRAPGGRPKTTLKTGFGSLGAANGGISHSRTLWGGKFLAALNRDGSDGNFSYRNDNGTPFNPDDDYSAVRQNNGHAMTDFLLKWEDDHWNVRLGWSRDDRDLPSPAPGMDKPDSPRGARLDTSRWDAALSRRQKAGAVDWGWRLEYLAQDKVYDNPDNMLGGLGERHNEYRARRFTGALDANWAWGPRHFFEASLTGGGETLGAEGDIVTLYGGASRFSQTTRRAALQDSISLAKDGSLLLTPSVRWDSSEKDGKTTWAAALTYRPGGSWLGGSWMFKTGYGTYSRAPNLYERHGDGAMIRPNQDLKWETGTQWDFGVLWSGSWKKSNVTAGLTYFERRTDDMIEFIMASPRFGIYENIAKAEARGLEFEGRAEWRLWEFALSGTWMNAENKTPDNYRAGRRLPNAPQWAWTARLTRRFQDKKGNVRASAFAEGQFTGDNYFDQNEQVRYDDLFLLNAGIKWSVRENLDVTFGVYDALDNGPDVQLRAAANGPNRMSWYPLPGRAFYMTLNWSF